MTIDIGNQAAKIVVVYQCPDCVECFDNPKEAAHHCVDEDIPMEYKCLHCGFVWPTISQALRCYEVESK